MKKLQLFLALLVLAGLLLPAAYAADGSGGGENSDNPLELVSCSPASGTADLPLDCTISMDFSKNVVNLAVKEQNMSCFSVTDSTGQLVPIVVEMGDDQVDRDARHTIVIRPVGQWPAGETLVLAVRADLSAKSGSTMAGPVTLTFTTAGGSDEPDPPVDTSFSPESVPSAESPSSSESVPSAEPLPSSESAPPAESPPSSESVPSAEPLPPSESVPSADTPISEVSPTPESEISPDPEESLPTEAMTPSTPPAKPVETDLPQEVPETAPSASAPDTADTPASQFPVVPVLGGTAVVLLVLVYFLTRVRKNKK